MKNVTKTYTNSEVTIVWKPELCIHSGICFRGLNEVFDPKERPWARPEAATSDRIVQQIKKCPSGALSHYLNQEVADTNNIPVETETIVETFPNGPLLV